MEYKLTRSGRKAFLAPIIWIVGAGVVFFLASGDIGILRVWIYIGIYVTSGITIGIILFKESPKLLNDRGVMQEGTKQLDKYIIISYFVFAIVITPFIAGIDRRLNLINPLPFLYLYIGIVMYFLSVFFFTWSMIHNPFFEGTIRVQKEKNQYVVKTGPYKIVRHPGYLGMLCGSISIPLALGSVLAFIPLVFMIIIIVIRTCYEDKTLQNELTGYCEYCKEVKYRLIPYIW